MDWLGIGVLVIGLAFLVLVLLLIKPLNRLAGLFGSLQKTTDHLPQQVEEITTQAKAVLGSGNDALNQINNQVKELSPLFYIAGDIGRATNQMFASLAEAVIKMERTTAEANDLTHRKNLEGLYGVLTLGYYVFQRSKSHLSETARKPLI
ncbi:DUF948 domain-containing protein [Virgibacillus sp. C22-A2]|uniref:DUF948 domain-containing protein n=1 Tax=Virgibacillus tibetensis TaxID=3042313 RepID=A0ABU6KM19_9BACI|nr:DUF948 domain-containing protein [Virgibacillus sp. C22-A2]